MVSIQQKTKRRRKRSGRERAGRKKLRRRRKKKEGRRKKEEEEEEEGAEKKESKESSRVHDYMVVTDFFFFFSFLVIYSCRPKLVYWPKLAGMTKTRRNGLEFFPRWNKRVSRSGLHTGTRFSGRNGIVFITLLFARLMVILCNSK